MYIPYIYIIYNTYQSIPSHIQTRLHLYVNVNLNAFPQHTSIHEDNFKMYPAMPCTHVHLLYCHPYVLQCNFGRTLTPAHLWSNVHMP